MKKIFTVILIFSAIIYGKAQAPNSFPNSPSGFVGKPKPMYKFHSNTMIISSRAPVACAPGSAPVPNGFPNSPYGNYQPAYVTDCDYQQILGNLRNTPGDFYKMNYLRSLSGRFFFSSNQVRNFMLHFQQDNNRFEMAKLFYPYIWDTQNLFLVVNSFCHQYYRDQFFQYIGGGNCGSGGAGHFPGNQGPYGGQYPYYQYLSTSDFHQLKQAIRKQTFSSDKIIIMKQGIAGRMISSAQVCEIIGLFTFESEKLEAAKHLYDFTYDPQNYYLVNNSFTFSSSVRELNEYILQRR